MDLSRRQFFKLKPGKAAELAMTPKDVPPPPPQIRPPGALPDTDAFRATCTGCKLCSEACRFDVVFFAGPESGPDEGKAYLEPAEAPCRWCEDFPCIAACPEGALTFGELETVPPIARAEVDLTACLNSFGVLCDDCATVCPSSIRAVKVVSGIPILNDELCTGCGLCAFHCEADSTAIYIKRIDEE